MFCLFYFVLFSLHGKLLQKLARHWHRKGKERVRSRFKGGRISAVLPACAGSVSPSDRYGVAPFSRAIDQCQYCLFYFFIALLLHCYFNIILFFCYLYIFYRNVISFIPVRLHEPLRLAHVQRAVVRIGRARGTHEITRRHRRRGGKRCCSLGHVRAIRQMKVLRFSLILVECFTLKRRLGRLRSCFQCN